MMNVCFYGSTWYISGISAVSASSQRAGVILPSYSYRLSTTDVWRGMHHVLLIRISAEYSHGVYVKIPLYSLFVVIAILLTYAVSVIIDGFGEFGEFLCIYCSLRQKILKPKFKKKTPAIAMTKLFAV